MFIQTEPTPNPATLKFLPGRSVLPHGTLEMRDKAAANQSPLAERLFEVEGVSGVFFGSDFISVTKAGASEWHQLKPAILGAIMEHFMSGAAGAARRGPGGGRRSRKRGVLRPGGHRDGRPHQGSDRDAGASGGRQ